MYAIRATGSQHFGADGNTYAPRRWRMADTLGAETEFAIQNGHLAAVADVTDKADKRLRPWAVDWTDGLTYATLPEIPALEATIEEQTQVIAALRQEIATLRGVAA